MITRIYWRRTYLFVEYEAADNDAVALASEKGTKRIPMICEPSEDDPSTMRAHLNLTVAEGREMLSQGFWNLVDADTGEPIPAVDQVLFDIEDFSRVFRYSKNRFAYAVTFHIVDSADRRPCLKMYVDYLRENPKARVQEGRLRPIKACLNAYYQVLCRLFPKNGTNIMFMSENMDHIRDNMKAIDTRIHERGLDDRFKVTYNFRNIFGHAQNPISWLKTIHKIARQDYIFVDDYVPIFGFLKLHPAQKLIQTWHAGFGFKLVGYGRFGIDGSPHPFVSCHRNYTYALVGNEHLREIYTEVFGIEEQALLATGMPRLERFLDETHAQECVEAFYQAHPDLQGKRIVLFAPTYRGIDQASAHYDYDQLDMDRLYAWAKESNAAVLFKMHHFIREPYPIKPEHADLFLDLSGENLNDLFYVSDVLITDYSSCFYDYLLLQRPILFFVYDKAYYAATRGVHRPVDEVAPGTVCNNFDELMDALSADELRAPEAAAMLTDKCLVNDRMASDKVIDYVLLGLEVPDICAQ